MMMNDGDYDEDDNGGDNHEILRIHASVKISSFSIQSITSAI